MSFARVHEACFSSTYTEKTEKENGEVAANEVSDFYREPRAAARLLSPFDLTLTVSSLSLSSPSPVLSVSLSLSLSLSAAHRLFPFVRSGSKRPARQE